MQCVRVESPLEDALDLDGNFDPAIADENEFEWTLTCKDCGKESTGTAWDLSDEQWEWEVQLRNDSFEILSSEAICAGCNDSVDQAQKTLNEDFHLRKCSINARGDSDQ